MSNDNVIRVEDWSAFKDERAWEAWRDDVLIKLVKLSPIVAQHVMQESKAFKEQSWQLSFPEPVSDAVIQSVQQQAQKKICETMMWWCMRYYMTLEALGELE